MGRIRKTFLATLTIGILAGLPFQSAVLAKKEIRVWLQGSYVWKTAVDKYNKQHPNTHITLLTGDLDKFYTMITAGMMPDVWGPWDTPGITADVLRNWALDLGPYIKRDGKEIGIDDFFPGLMRQFKVRGKQYSLPIFCDADWFFYNTDKWARAGLKPPTLNAKDKSWNWDAMVLAAQKTVKRSSDGNRILEAGLEFDRGFWCTPNWVHLWGVKLYNDEALKTAIPQDIDLNSSKMSNAIEQMWNLIYKYKVVNPTYQAFSNGKTGASLEAGYWVFNLMKEKKLKWALAPLPWAVTNSGTLWPDGMRVSKISKNKELAWDFVKFLCSPENMRAMATDPKSDRRGSSMARKSVYMDTLGVEVSKVTGMRPEDVYKIHEAADDVGIVKESETICLHTDLSKQYIEPVLNDIWANKVQPRQATQALDTRARKGMGILFQRWMRNVKYTGKQL